MNTPQQIRPGPMYQGSKPVRDREYLKFIRLLPCVACGRRKWGMQAMHTGPHGIGQKASDLDALPGCPTCHRELHKIGPERFQFKHHLDFEALRTMFQHFYQTKMKGRAA